MKARVCPLLVMLLAFAAPLTAQRAPVLPAAFDAVPHLASTLDITPSVAFESVEAPGLAPVPHAEEETAYGSWIVVGAAGGAVLGTVLGGYLGYELDVRPQGGPSGFGSLFTGAVVGQSLLIPTGAHLGGGRRGQLERLMTATGLIGAAALLMPELVFVAPIAEVLLASAIEYRTGRSSP